MWTSTWFESRPGRRITPLDRSDELFPWLRAYELDEHFLYWMPSNWPVTADQRSWLMGFFDRLVRLLNHKLALEPFVFVRYKTVLDLQEEFERRAFEFQPRLGLGRRPGVVPNLRPQFSPGDTDIRRVKDRLPDYCYWLLAGPESGQRQAFLGYGGMSYAFKLRDPKTIPPPIPFSEKFQSKHPIFKAIDVKSQLARLYATQDGFQAESKALLGAGLEQEPQFRGIPFILPLVTTQDFFNRPAEEVRVWFQLFPIYVCESPEDGGLLLASSIDIENRLIRLLQHMSKHGLTYSDPRW